MQTWFDVIITSAFGILIALLFDHKDQQESKIKFLMKRLEALEATRDKAYFEAAQNEVDFIQNWDKRVPIHQANPLRATPLRESSLQAFDKFERDMLRTQLQVRAVAGCKGCKSCDVIKARLRELEEITK